MNIRKLFLLAALTVTSSALAESNPPFFDLNEWQRHPGGPKVEPFNLQKAHYYFDIDVQERPLTRDAVPGYLRIYDSMGELKEESHIMIKVRGFSSFNFPKMQYGIKLVDEFGEDREEKLLGMSKAEDWVLAAPYNDKSLVRDILTFNLSNLIGRNAPKTRIGHLTLRVGTLEADFAGIYVLTEKNDIGKGRIDIDKKNELGTSFVAAFDHPQPTDHVLWRGTDNALVLDYPKKDKITPEQTAEFMHIFNDMEYRTTYPHGAAWDNIFDDRVDLDSAVDFFIMQELSRNIDGYRLSSFFYIPPKGKIHFGPIWDFNLAYGNAKHENGIQAHAFRAIEKGMWYNALFYHPKFCKAAKARWQSLRADGTLSNDTIFGVIDAHSRIMQPLTEGNFHRWPSLGRYLWPNPYWLETWYEETIALKSWISLRTAWLDTAVQEWNCDVTLPLPGTNSSRSTSSRL